jgi:hypothetical protein
MSSTASSFGQKVLKAALCALSALFCLLAGPAAAQGSVYEEQVSKWSSHEDVAAWLQSNFVFDKDRQQQVAAQLREKGPEGVLTRKTASLYSLKRGYCRDAAGFARDALNRIKPAYNARYIFIKNGSGTTNHWVTGFTVDKKIFVIDYGAGPEWSPMIGVHGPYASLDEYRDFLASLRIRRFSPDFVKWRDYPGQED